MNKVDPVPVILESPFAGNFDENIAYARQALKHSLTLGEAPLASHLLYTQALDDDIPHERNLGIEAGLSWLKFAARTVVYADLGISKGMQYGIERAKLEGREVDIRYIRRNAND